MITRTVATRTATVAVALTLSAVLAGCASSTSPTSSAPPATASSPATSSTAPAAQTHNRADITFATEMIPHHAQAVSMSALAARQASSPRVKDLAARIEAAQQPEIDQMSGWLRAWDAPVPDTDATGTGGMSGMAHGDTSQNNQSGMSHGSGAMPGMMSQQQTHQLSQANGAAFDAMFLQMMIGHHQGAVTMSQTELADGENPDAKTLAQNIITAQQREITEMQTMLAHG